ncbi:unnamed protein product [Mytilus edulis]|uniref:Uncharacterized protein n=1 Tax=Mytilus edulis TaxID=6550 RepID=A0A8S3SGS4_MYTED|nr:unnamed protein product [Mytilus edulis]
MSVHMSFTKQRTPMSVHMSFTGLPKRTPMSVHMSFTGLPSREHQCRYICHSLNYQAENTNVTYVIHCYQAENKMSTIKHQCRYICHSLDYQAENTNVGTYVIHWITKQRTPMSVHMSFTGLKRTPRYIVIHWITLETNSNMSFTEFTGLHMSTELPSREHQCRYICHSLNYQAENTNVVHMSFTGLQSCIYICHSLDYQEEINVGTYVIH